MSKAEPPSIEELKNGAELTYRNAKRLYEEALILKSNGRAERSLFLHQISLEECAKIELIGQMASAVLSGQKLDSKTFAKKIRSHESKNHTNAYAIPADSNEINAREKGNLEESLELFNKIKRDYHKKQNNNKNDSLYVNFEDGIFTSPEDAISIEALEKISEENKIYLERIPSKLSVLKRMAKSPDKHSKVLKEFLGLMMAQKEAGDKLPTPEEILTTLANLHNKHDTNRPNQDG